MQEAPPGKIYLIWEIINWTKVAERLAEVKQVKEVKS